VREQGGIEHGQPQGGQRAERTDEPPRPDGQQNRQRERAQHAARAHGQAADFAPVEGHGLAAVGQAAERVEGEDRHPLSEGRHAGAAGEEPEAVGDVVGLVVDEALVEAARDQERRHDGQQQDRRQTPHARPRGDRNEVSHRRAGS
jgi:hypothetical protein